MRIVSENSAQDIARNRAQEKVDWALRELAANILRIVRGAGKSYEIGRQAQAVVEAMRVYHRAWGEPPPPDKLDSAISIQRDEVQPTGDASLRHRAVEQIVSGALQIAASRLNGQRRHEAAGMNELHNGMQIVAQLNDE